MTDENTPAVPETEAPQPTPEPTPETTNETPEPETTTDDSVFADDTDPKEGDIAANRDGDLPLAKETADDAPDHDWGAIGPRLWAVLRNLLGGNKTCHPDKIVIDADHEDVAEAHDILAQQPE